jgi:DNA modification methylase
LKPLPLVEKAIRLIDAPVVYDPFLGSGTTLIACERLNRKCRAVEISPAYCAVAIERWADMTGQEPELLYSENTVNENG